jgi:hypothetical protein
MNRKELEDLIRLLNQKKGEIDKRDETIARLEGEIDDVFAEMERLEQEIDRKNE